MADKRDPKLSARYRELGAEEPPRALDEAILAASRRAVEARPAPLVAPTGRRRWYFPVAAAAIITLAVAVTVQVERQRPDDEFVAAQSPAPKPLEEKAELALKEERVLKSAPAKVRPAEPPRSRTFTPDPPAPAAPPPAQPSADSLGDLAKSNQAPPAAAAEAARPSRRMEAERQARPQDGMRASGAAAALYVGPQRWLEQIAELRKEGKHDDADKLLEEFRKTYPDYRISDEMRAKVEKK